MSTPRDLMRTVLSTPGGFSAGRSGLTPSLTSRIILIDRVGLGGQAGVLLVVIGLLWI